MKAVILAGGRGTRLSEETSLKPKSLVEANGKPLIWHIMMNYSRSGITDFIILSGYKGNLIREYFANFWLHQADLTFDLTNSSQEVHNVRGLPWKVTVIDTGINTNTGGRIGRLRELLKEDFFLSYGDGISDVDFNALLALHKENNNFITLTAVQPPARFGALKLMGTQVQSFQEKPEGDGAWVNGGFFVITPKIFDYIESESASLEIDILPRIASQGKLGSYKHFGYWQPVDTIRDLQRLEESIESGSLPWI